MNDYEAMYFSQIFLHNFHYFREIFDLFFREIFALFSHFSRANKMQKKKRNFRKTIFPFRCKPKCIPPIYTLA